MSTRLLQTMIEAHRQGTSVSTEAICEAERELEAIRNAAAAITKGGDLSDEMMARGLLERIAEEA